MPPNTPSFLPERIAASIPLLLLPVLAQFVRVIAAKFDWVAKILAYLFSIQYFDLILKSSASLVYVSGCMMVLTALAPIFSTFQSLGCFLGFYLSISTAVSYYASPSPVSIFIQFFGSITIGIFTLYSLYFKIKASELIKKEAQQREKEINQSFARVSHDLKTPLIFLTAQLTQIAKEPDPDILRQKLEEVSIKHKIRTNLVMDMMKDIRLLSGLEAPKKTEKVSLQTAWTISCTRIKEMQPILDFKGFSYTYQGHNFEVIINPSDLDRILENTIKNAAEAMLRPGKITLIASKLDHQRVQICIQNTESYIAPETLAKISNHEQVSTKAQGSGLGLQIIQHLVKKYSGQFLIHYEDQVFSLTFDLRGG